MVFACYYLMLWHDLNDCILVYERNEYTTVRMAMTVDTRPGVSTLQSPRYLPMWT